GTPAVPSWTAADRRRRVKVVAAPRVSCLLSPGRARSAPIQIWSGIGDVCNSSRGGTTGAPAPGAMCAQFHSLAARARDTRGTNLLEAAIITPLLIMLTFSIVDFGALFYVYLALENGVSQASRYGVTGNLMDDPAHPGTPLSRVDSMKTAMRQATPTLTLDDSAFTVNHMPAGGSSWVAGTGGPGEIEKVTIDYTWDILTPIMRPFFTNGQIHFTVDSAMKNEARFQ